MTKDKQDAPEPVWRDATPVEAEFQAKIGALMREYAPKVMVEFMASTFAQSAGQCMAHWQRDVGITDDQVDEFVLMHANAGRDVVLGNWEPEGEG